MPSHWKVLISSMLVMQVIITVVLLNLARYSIALHFSDGPVPIENLTDTMPGKMGLLWIVIPAALLFIITVRAFNKAHVAETSSSESEQA